MNVYILWMYLFIKILKKLIRYLWEKYSTVCLSEPSLGEGKMKEYLWHWTKGNTRIYTRIESVANKAMDEGALVVGEKIRSRIIKF